MVDWEEEGVSTQEVLTKRMIDTVGLVILLAVVMAVLCFV
ncbi:hypothetical protein SAMN02744775_00192 [Enterobacter sp. CC120223-11]|nr:hypothetical protein SAMN02744775_00192 [Enterobacter sp. CC120223-11]